MVITSTGIPNIPPGSRAPFNQQMQYPTGRPPPSHVFVPYADGMKEVAQREMTRRGFAPPGGFPQSQTQSYAQFAIQNNIMRNPSPAPMGGQNYMSMGGMPGF